MGENIDSARTKRLLRRFHVRIKQEADEHDQNGLNENQLVQNNQKNETEINKKSNKKRSEKNGTSTISDIKWRMCSIHVLKAVKENKPRAKILRELRKEFGERAPPRQMVYEWLAKLTKPPTSQSSLTSSLSSSSSSSLSSSLSPSPSPPLPTAELPSSSTPSSNAQIFEESSEVIPKSGGAYRSEWCKYSPRIGRMREFIKSGVSEGKAAAQIFNELVAKFGKNNALSIWTVYKWVRDIKQGAAVSGSALTAADTESNSDVSHYKPEFMRVIRRGIEENKTKASIHRELVHLYGSKAPSSKTVSRWINRLDCASIRNSAKQNEPTAKENPSVAAETTLKINTTPNSMLSKPTSNKRKIKGISNEAIERRPRPNRIVSESSDDEDDDNDVQFVSKSTPSLTPPKTPMVSAAATATASTAMSSNVSRIDVETLGSRLVGEEEDVECERYDHVSGLIPVKILGESVLDGKRFFLVKWKDCVTTDLLSYETMRFKYPQMLLDFFEEKLRKVNSNANQTVTQINS